MSHGYTGLTDAQAAELKASAISAEVAARQGLFSVDDPKAAAKLFGRTAKQWEGHLPVLCYPYRIPLQRDPVLVRGKPAKPFESRRKDGSIELAKYTQAKDTGSHIMFGPSLWEGTALRDSKIPLLFTEGEKKMLAAESAGFSCVALPGVNQWHVKGEKQLHPYFAHLGKRDREAFMCFDADALANKDVRREELAFARALQAAGMRVYIVRFPPDAPKLDDFLATHEMSEFYLLLDDARKHGALPPDTSSANVPEEWQEVFSQLRLDGDTQLPVKDVDNIAAVLMFHPKWQGVLTFDARRERQTFVKPPPFPAHIAIKDAPIPRPVSDTDVTRIAYWLALQPALGWQLSPKPSQLEQAISIVCERNRTDSVRDYLVALTWDKTPRLDTMAATYFGAKDTAYTRAVFAKWMLSAVARARTPGCQVDHVLVLEGPQGLGKSTALRVLAGSEHFSDTLPELGRDAHEHCIGPWIIELAELDHMRKTEVTALKAFISARAPSFRSAYGRRTADHPRRCVFAATTNESVYLADSTGNRRFWPVECTKADVEGLARDRDQLWAEALVRIRAGEDWHISDPKVREEAEEEQADRRQVDPWVELLIPYLRGRKVVTIADVLDHLGFGGDDAPSGFGTYSRGTAKKGRHYDQRSANRVAAILREAGWVRRQVRVDGERVWKYVIEQPAVTGSRASGDRGVTGQVVDFNRQKPVSPVSPDDPVSNAGARDVQAGMPSQAPTPEIRPAPSSPSDLNSSFNFSSSDTGDSSDNGEVSATYDVTAKSPPPDATSDSPAKPRRVY